jgi:hypothetical protein
VANRVGGIEAVRELARERLASSTRPSQTCPEEEFPVAVPA